MLNNRIFDIEEMDGIIKEVHEEIEEILLKANRSGELRNILKVLNLEYILGEESSYKTCPEGKIVILGESKVKAEEIYGIGKSFGLAKNRFELCLSYDEVKRYNVEKLRYEPLKYAVVLAGPHPHKTIGTGDSSSLLSEIEKTSGYPPLYRLISNENLKITKSNLKTILKKLLDKGIIAS